MSELKDFNINNRVFVKLTECGKDELIRQHVNLCERFTFMNKKLDFKEDEEGWSKWTLWELMAKLGHMCHQGCEVPFETRIRLQKKDMV